MRILLTGAAGLIGGELTARLAANGHAVVALVHREPAIAANAGTVIVTSPWDGSGLAAGTVATLHGDITRPMLGLGESERTALARTIDLVVHCAAVTAFDAPSDRYHAVNVVGTSNALAVCPDAAFLYVSTAYVCGLRNGLIPETPRDPAYGFANGYEASKAAAEAVVLAAGGTGRRVAIARPSIVVGDHERGMIRSFDTIYAAFRVIAEGRISALPARADATLDFVPICHVADGLADIVDHWPAAIGGIYHIVSGAPVAVADWVGAIRGFPHLHAPRLVPPEDFSEDMLRPAERRLYRRSASLYASYFERDPRFADDRLRELSGRRCPAVDDGALARMIGYCLERGFLKAA